MTIDHADGKIVRDPSSPCHEGLGQDSLNNGAWDSMLIWSAAPIRSDADRHCSMVSCLNCRQSEELELLHRHVVCAWR